MDDKFFNFLNNARELNKAFGIIPLLYGSLGLEVLTNTNLNSSDIDILIPENFVVGDKWKSFKLFLENNDYILIDKNEHTFRKNGVEYSYASIENLKEFIGIDENLIQQYKSDDILYKLLSLEQYLKVYKKSSTDGYRMNKKEKKDNEKIKFIEEHLQNGKSRNF